AARGAPVLANGRVAAEGAEAHGAVVEHAPACGHATVGRRRRRRGDAPGRGIVVEATTIAVAQAGEREEEARQVAAPAVAVGRLLAREVGDVVRVGAAIEGDAVRVGLAARIAGQERLHGGIDVAPVLARTDGAADLVDADPAGKAGRARRCSRLR